MAYDLRNEEEVKQYLDNLGTEYRFSCLHEKNAEGCHLLAEYLEVVKHDYKKAATIFKNNCDDSNYPRSCLKYGNFAFIGRGCDTDPGEAIKYYKKGCQLQNAESCYHSGVMLISQKKYANVEQNVVEGLKYLDEGCKAKIAMSCFLASGVYIRGSGVPKDMLKASELSLRGCEMGDIPSCVNLSRMYKKGDGVEKNEELATKYKSKALQLKKAYKNIKHIEFGQCT